ncbi:ligase-associated DNA damage response endonuclease PdeM [Niabella insulamsoli]|uniref:ligase-associated DNA damage response endonuclease PdeM n=1 Tax=Niabella insulamsoli TaxID=3144874 RepID=UPI0031FBD948
MEVFCSNERLILSHHRAAYWPAQQTVFIADLHLGKTGYFRSRGIAIPSSVMASDLERLDEVVRLYQPEQVVIAGDMFHHNYNADIDVFKTWRASKKNIRFLLVPGNHDRLLKIDYQQLGIITTNATHFLDPFTVIHEPQQRPGVFAISGHLHPGYLLAGRARQSIKLPCFVVRHDQLILPAFSAFTGLYTGYAAQDGDKYYLIGEHSIYSV